MDKLKERFKGTQLYRKIRQSRCIKALINELARQDLSRTIRKTHALSRKNREEQKADLEQAIQRNDFSFIRGVIRHNLLNDMQLAEEHRYNELAALIIETLQQTLEQRPKIMQKMLSKVEVRFRERFYNYLIQNKQTMILMTQLIPKLWLPHRAIDIQAELAALFSSSTQDNDHQKLLACGLVTSLWANPDDWNVGKILVAMNGAISSRLIHLNTTPKYETMTTEERLHKKIVEQHEEAIIAMQQAIQPLQSTPKREELNLFLNIIYKIRMCLFEKKIGDKIYHFSILNNSYLDEQLEKITPATLSQLKESIKTSQLSPPSCNIDLEIKNAFDWQPLEDGMGEELIKTDQTQGELTSQQNKMEVNDFLWRALLSTL
ncbi:hypothetical protein GCM10023116_40420 [Kistimonas scapharcae]|uniref:Uncharacterized protein n=2 Tax=Kistimonas scapharcae TaxID=1036133 RepID=A0ABP8V8B0_9GAMM